MVDLVEVFDRGDKNAQLVHRGLSHKDGSLGIAESLVSGFGSDSNLSQQESWAACQLQF
jgi:hypothetical protein